MIFSFRRSQYFISHTRSLSINLVPRAFPGDKVVSPYIPHSRETLCGGLRYPDRGLVTNLSDHYHGNNIPPMFQYGAQV